MSHKVAIYPGTFDPITLGHLDILERATLLFDEIILAVSEGTNKVPVFSIEERIRLVSDAVQALGLKNVLIKSFQGLLVDFAQNENTRIIIRGMRALSDFEYEFQMAYVNRKLLKNLETIFLPATERGHFISSTFVKEVARLGGDLTGLVPDVVAQSMSKRYPCKAK